MMKVGRSLFMLALMVPAAPTQKSDPFLDQSYMLSQSLSGNEKFYYLSELTRVSTLIKPPLQQAQEWCMTMFRVAKAATDQRNRIAGQKNALIQMTSFDPTLAMELLAKVDGWRPGPGQMLYEDLRSNAAEVIFISFLKSHPQGISTVVKQARNMAQDGQYPYRAMAAVIRHIKLPREEVNNIVSDALNSYAHETGFINRDEEFLVLLQALKKAPLDKELASLTAGTFVKRLTRDPIQTQANYYGEIHTSAGNVVAFADRNLAFLFEAFPVIDKLNRPLADELRGEHRDLSKAKGEMHYISGGFVMGNPTTEEAMRRHMHNIQRSLANRIKEIQDCDPWSAALLAQRLTGISSRIIGFSSIVPGMARRNPTHARIIYSRQLSEFRDVGGLPNQLDAAVALTRAAASVGDSASYKSNSAEAFDMGIRFYNGSTADRAENRSGFEQLHEIVSFTASQPTDSLNARIQQLPSGWLKAYLLLYEAEGHANRKYAGGTCSDHSISAAPHLGGAPHVPPLH